MQHHVIPLCADAVSSRLSSAARAFYTVTTTKESPSTNTELKTKAAELPAGTVLIAETQTAGRGRRGRTFHSPRNTGLYMSVLIRPDMRAADALYLTTATAAVCADAIDRFRGTAYPPARIKWVNDVYVTDGNSPKKAVGILCESVLTPGCDRLAWAVVGIGVNVITPKDGFPEDIARTAGALFPEDAPEVDRNLLAAMILDGLYTAMQDPQTPAVCDAYRARSVLDGKPILIRPASSLGGEEIPAVAVCIDASMGLRVRYPDGHEEVLSSGEVVTADDDATPTRASVHLAAE